MANHVELPPTPPLRATAGINTASALLLIVAAALFGLESCTQAPDAKAPGKDGAQPITAPKQPDAPKTDPDPQPKTTPPPPDTPPPT